MFAAFILACGTTHFLEIWVLWHPEYRLQGLMKALTAAISLATAVALWRLVPQALALPTPAQFQRVSVQLYPETEQRTVALDRARRTEQAYRQVVNGLTDYAIYVLDPEGRVTTWNDGAQRITGDSAEEILGQSIARFYTQADRTAGVPLQALATARTTGR